jgi:hypothetical protein
MLWFFWEPECEESVSSCQRILFIITLLHILPRIFPIVPRRDLLFLFLFRKLSPPWKLWPPYNDSLEASE